MPQSEITSTAVPPPPPPAVRDRSRPMRFALFLAMLAWYGCARGLAESAANGLTLRFNLIDAQPLLRAVFLVFLVLLGLATLRRLDRRYTPLSIVIGLPRRKTSAEEWGVGAAIGWGISVVSVLPLALTRSLNMEVWTGLRAFLLLSLAVLTVALTTLANALALFGFGLQHLIEATGRVRATMLMMAIVGFSVLLTPTPFGTPNGTRLIVTLLATILLCIGWIRTHAVWLVWGLHFAWAASTALLFGLPISSEVPYNSVIQTHAIGSAWLTGGSYGPGAAAFSVLLLLVAIPLLVRVTSDYAWDYTRPPIIPAGYEVEIAPPAAHAAMEQATAPPPPPLVQISPAPPNEGSRE